MCLYMEAVIFIHHLVLEFLIRGKVFTLSILPCHLQSSEFYKLKTHPFSSSLFLYSVPKLLVVSLEMHERFYIPADLISFH